MTTIAPIHPGEVLLEEFLVPLEVTQHRLAVSIGVPPRRINEIVHGKRRITADTALAGTLLRHHRPVLAQPADPLRPRDRKGPPWRRTRPHPAATERLTRTHRGMSGRVATRESPGEPTCSAGVLVCHRESAA